MDESKIERKQICDSDGIEELFCRLDDVLEKPLEITIMGAAALLVLGFHGRATMDIDVWDSFQREASIDFQEAVEKSGIPISGDLFEEPREPYIQVVDDRATHMPINNNWMEKRTPLWRGNRLLVWTPPLEMMAASKLSLGRDKDFDDVRFLLSLENDLERKIYRMADNFSSVNKENILGNLELLRLLLNRNSLNNDLLQRDSLKGETGLPKDSSSVDSEIYKTKRRPV